VIIVQTIFSGVLAFFTAILAWVTYLYYEETKSHTREMRKSRRAEFKPVIQSKINHLHGIHYRFSLKNVGKGAAHNVKAGWKFEGVDHIETWEIPLISSDQEHEFAFPFSEDKFSKSTKEQIEGELGGLSGELHFYYECEDSLGNKFSDIQRMNLVDKIKGREAGEIVQKDELKEIRKSIEGLQDSIGEVSDEIEMSGFEDYLRRNKVQNVIQTVKEEEKLSLSALSNLSGIKQKELVKILRKLKEENFVDYSEDLHPVSRETRNIEIEYLE
jgi:hypothetical protein